MPRRKTTNRKPARRSLGRRRSIALATEREGGPLTANQLRPPVVVVMGHIDHGKTTLLDYIRKTPIQEKEAGGITQSIGAYQVELKKPPTTNHQPPTITFIDTPGHEAFTAMRARGGQAADIAVLVVAANDGVMPQTIEAINHAKAAKIPIIVAVNKIDLPEADSKRAINQLAKTGVLIEKMGGDIVCVEVSAKTGKGVDELLEMILLVAEMLELKADPNLPAQGVVLESSLDARRGVTTTLIVKNGTLRIGDFCRVGSAKGGFVVGKIKNMTDWQGGVVKEAGPSMPVEALGFKKVVLAGQPFEVVTDGKPANAEDAEKSAGTQRPIVPSIPSLPSLEQTELKELKLIIKTDTQGSYEAVHHSVEKLQTEEVKITFIHEGIGNISEADIMLAVATSAIVLGFRVGIDAAAKNAAKMEKVLYRTYDIIYHLLEEIEDVITGKEEEGKIEVIGEAKILKVFVLSDKTKIAGCKVTDGILKKGNNIQIVRGEDVIADSKIISMRHEKEKISEAEKGVECGLAFTKEIEFQEGDLVQAFKIKD
ncbi:MAG: translation initiation factor IF-2 [Candidatus Cloacimonetes bacterium]|nr:translation initiation factor IF-2 [Candidatus Cloacimonadota bacterium]